MSDELPTVIGRRIVGWAVDMDLGDDIRITLTLDDGRLLIFEAAERCGDDPVVYYYIKEKQ